MVVLIESSKMDQLREGAEVVMARTGTRTCPIAVLEQYVRIADIDPLSNARLFCAIVKSKNGERLRKGRGISYSQVRELLLEKLRYLGYESSLFGVHSFRAGRATTAANSGVPDVVLETWSLALRKC